MNILKEVQELTSKIEQSDPKLELEQNNGLKKLVNEKFDERIDI